MPALLTTMSSRPKSRTVAANAASTCVAVRRRRSGTTRASTPSSASSRAACSPDSASISSTATPAPARASSSAMPRPETRAGARDDRDLAVQLSYRRPPPGRAGKRLPDERDHTAAAASRVNVERGGAVEPRTTSSGGVATRTSSTGRSVEQREQALDGRAPHLAQRHLHGRQLGIEVHGHRRVVEADERDVAAAPRGRARLAAASAPIAARMFATKSAVGRGVGAEQTRGRQLAARLVVGRLDHPVRGRLDAGGAHRARRSRRAGGARCRSSGAGDVADVPMAQREQVLCCQADPASSSTVTLGSPSSSCRLTRTVGSGPPRSPMRIVSLVAMPTRRPSILPSMASSRSRTDPVATSSAYPAREARSSAPRAIVA